MRRTRRRKSRLGRTDAVQGYLFASPWLIGFLCLTLGPMLFSLGLSFCRWDLNMPGSQRFVGILNYAELLFNDRLLWKALYNTAYYSFFGVPLAMIMALTLAMLLNQKVKGIYFYRTVFYLPSIVAGVATIVMWQWLFNPEFGMVNEILGFFGLPRPGWLVQPAWCKPVLIIMRVWTVGAAMLIYLAGLQGIPQHLYEVADIDGAGPIRKFFAITLPMLTPTIFFNLVMSIIGSFQIFTAAYVLVGNPMLGGPDDSLLFYVYYLYRSAFVTFRMGYASAMAWILFVIILAFTMLVIRSSGLWVYYEGERR